MFNVLGMQSFFEECVLNHYLSVCEKRDLQQIFQKHGFGRPIEALFSEKLLCELKVHLSNDCAKICDGYIALDKTEPNCILEPDERKDCMILRKLKPLSLRALIVGNAALYGVCNTLIHCTLFDDHLGRSQKEFIRMFVGVAEVYGEDIWIQMLQYCKIVPLYQNVYEEGLNQVAESLLKVRTRCCRGDFIWPCCIQNEKIYYEFRSLHKKDEVTDVFSEICDRLRTKYAPLLPIFHDETFTNDNDTIRYNKKRKNSNKQTF